MAREPRAALMSGMSSAHSLDHVCQKGHPAKQVGARGARVVSLDQAQRRAVQMYSVRPRRGGRKSLESAQCPRENVRMVARSRGIDAPRAVRTTQFMTFGSSIGQGVRGGAAMEPSATEHWEALREHTRQEALLRRAADAFASREAKRERALTVDLELIKAEIDDLQTEASEGADEDEEDEDEEHGADWESAYWDDNDELDDDSVEALEFSIAEELGGSGPAGAQGEETRGLVRVRSRSVSVAPTATDGTEGEGARLAGALAQSRSIRAQRSASIVGAAAAAADDSDLNLPATVSPQSGASVQLVATQLETAALRQRLNSSLENANATKATKATVAEAEGSLFEAFIIVGGGVSLADEIRTACDYWKPSKAEAEYEALAARTEAEVMCIYPPSTDAGASESPQLDLFPYNLKTRTSGNTCTKTDGSDARNDGFSTENDEFEQGVARCSRRSRCPILPATPFRSRWRRLVQCDWYTP